MRIRCDLLLILVGLFVGCDSKNQATSNSTETAPADGPRIALLMKARTNPFFDKMAAGAERKAKELHVNLEVLAIDKETDSEKQAAQVETVTSKGVQAILIAPADSKAIIAPLLQAQQRGIKIINLDNRINADEAKKAGLKIEAFIGPNNVAGAHKSAAAMIEKIEKDPSVAVSSASRQVAMLEGIRGVDNAEARKKGFQEAVDATRGRVQIVAMDTGEWMTEPAQKKMESILNAHPDLKGVFCANDMMALGVIQAVASAGKTGKIIVASYDNLDAARQAIKAGSLYATIEQHPDKMGELGVEFALKAISGENIPAEIPVPTDLVMAKDLQ